MPVIPFADFLAGAIMSLVIPTALLVAVTIWFHFQVRHVPRPPKATPRGATPENRPAANPATGGQKPVGEARGSTGAGS